MLTMIPPFLYLEHVVENVQFYHGLALDQVVHDRSVNVGNQEAAYHEYAALQKIADLGSVQR